MMFLICPLGSSTGLDNGYWAVCLFKYYISTIVVGSHFSNREGSMVKCWAVLWRIIYFSSLYLPSKPHILSSKVVVTEAT